MRPPPPPVVPSRLAEATAMDAHAAPGGAPTAAPEHADAAFPAGAARAGASISGLLGAMATANALGTASADATDGLRTVHRLDPRTIRVSAWANRHRRSFASPDFDKLKASIALVGVNIQAIKVRPVGSPGSPGAPRHRAKAAPGPAYEVVFGHRRHRACLELGIAVAAVIQELSDRDLFAEMDRENRTQRPLSPYEQGCMFKQALDEGLYPSARAMALELDVDTSLVSKALSIARLPEEVIQAFASPLDIQYRWAGPLNEAHRQDPASLIARAEILRQDADKRSSVRIFQRLVAPRRPARDPAAQISGRSGRATIQVDRRGRLMVVVEEPWSSDLPPALESVLRDMLNRA